MGRIAVAFKAFFKSLFDAAVAARVAEALSPSAPATPSLESAKPQPAERPKPAPAQSAALTLLAALQREARLVDFVKEPLADYSDAQVGAAARVVHRDCGAVLQRLFDLQPVLTEAEGSTIAVPEGFDAGRIRLTGNIGGRPPFSGRLVHPGWQATKVDIPTWSGGEAAARVVAPAEVELP